MYSQMPYPVAVGFEFIYWKSAIALSNFRMIATLSSGSHIYHLCNLYSSLLYESQLKGFARGAVFHADYAAVFETALRYPSEHR